MNISIGARRALIPLRSILMSLQIVLIVTGIVEALQIFVIGFLFLTGILTTKAQLWLNLIPFYWVSTVIKGIIYVIVTNYNELAMVIL
jgi:hypothetical protein